MINFTRRKFVKNISIASIVPFSFIKTNNIMAKEIFIHHVYFRLKNPTSEADKTKLIEGLEKLSKVPTIRMFHIGTPAATNRSVVEKSYSVSWLCFFDNLEDEEIYQQHPIHLKFVEDCSPLWEKVVVYDSVGPKR